MILCVCKGMWHTELGDPTKGLKALLGYQHLVDLKTLLPGQRYRADTEAGLARAGRRRHAVPG